MSARKPSRPVLIPSIGMFFLAYPAGSFQKSTVAADADDHVGLKVVTVEQFGRRNVQMKVVGQKTMELPADTKFCFPLVKDVQKGFGMR